MRVGLGPRREAHDALIRATVRVREREARLVGRSGLEEEEAPGEQVSRILAVRPQPVLDAEQRLRGLPRHVTELAILERDGAVAVVITGDEPLEAGGENGRVGGERARGGAVHLRRGCARHGRERGAREHAREQEHARSRAGGRAPVGQALARLSRQVVITMPTPR